MKTRFIAGMFGAALAVVGGAHAQSGGALSRIELLACLTVDYEKKTVQADLRGLRGRLDRMRPNRRASSENLADWNVGVGEERALVRTFNRMNTDYNNHCATPVSYLRSDATYLCRQRWVGRSLRVTNICRNVLAALDGQEGMVAVSADATTFPSILSPAETDQAAGAANEVAIYETLDPAAE